MFLFDIEIREVCILLIAATSSSILFGFIINVFSSSFIRFTAAPVPPNIIGNPMEAYSYNLEGTAEINFSSSCAYNTELI